MKYAMVLINHKYDDQDHHCCRRVLIQYESSKDDDTNVGPHRTNYLNTRFIEKDEYFKDPSKSHQYEFYDDGYVLLSDKHHIDNSFVNERRVYHGYDTFPNGNKSCIEFEADTDEEAIKIFHDRKEYR